MQACSEFPRINVEIRSQILIVVSPCIIELHAGFGDVNWNQFIFTLVDGPSGFHISNSTVSISYTFR
jgi:hypothetical protein